MLAPLALLSPPPLYLRFSSCPAAPFPCCTEAHLHNRRVLVPLVALHKESEHVDAVELDYPAGAEGGTARWVVGVMGYVYWGLWQGPASTAARSRGGGRRCRSWLPARQPPGVMPAHRAGHASRAQRDAATEQGTRTQCSAPSARSMHSTHSLERQRLPPQLLLPQLKLLLPRHVGRLPKAHGGPVDKQLHPLGRLVPR